jgi:hexulose-6-phosphate isomerase
LNNAIGIMQGRLFPPRGGRLQSFPAEAWQDEFGRARECGLDGIEWIFEEPWRENPLAAPQGIARMQELAGETGTRVLCACADYFMEHPLVRVRGQALEERVDMLRFVIGQCALAGIPILDVPCVDASAIQNDAEAQQVARVLSDVADLAQRSGVILGLETNLAPRDFALLLQRIDHPAVGATYDIGNSASLGYDPREETEAIGRRVVNVHVKDRVRNGGTVPLGEGSADMPATFAGLRDRGYAGPFILQVARGGEEMAHARRNAEFVRRLWNAERVSA